MFIRAVLIVLALAVPAYGSTKIMGTAEVTDGDTLRIGEHRIRLYGIDAPEMRQLCRLNDKPWKCGRASRDALEALVGGEFNFILCVTSGKDRYGRWIGWCLSNDEDGEQFDVGEEMVRQGHALAYRRYSENYIEVETEARKARRGLWAGEFESPWVWRAQRRR